MKFHGRIILWVIGFALLSSALTFSSAAGSPAQPADCINLLQDPGFEAGAPNPYWTEVAIYADTVFCSVAACGSGGVGPHSGAYWYFGGRYVDEYAIATQTVTIPEGNVSLSFYLAARAAAGSGVDDYFSVIIDNLPVFLTNAAQAGNYINYTPVTVDVSYLADGGVHDISFEVNTFSELVSYHVDDVTLCVEEITPYEGKQVFLPYMVMPPRVTQAPEFEPREVPWVDTRFTIKWNTVEGAATYVIEEDTDMNFSSPVVVYAGTETTWTATWKANTSYWYRVRGENGRGPGPWSDTMWIVYEGVYPTADAGIAAGASGTNFGSLSAMSVGYYFSSCPFGVPVATGTNRGLLYFDTAGVPADLNFSKVELSIFLDKICFISSLSGGERTITAYRVTSPWTEGGVTWNNAPGTGEGHGSVNIPLTTDQDVFGRYEIDITGLVRDWLNGSKPNYGLMLRSNVESGAGFTFDTRDGDGATPYLAITFNEGDTAEVAAALARIPPGERQCVVVAPGEMLCALRAK